MTDQTSGNQVADPFPPYRSGSRPLTRRQLPHVQLDQFPPAEMVGRLIEVCMSLPHVRAQESRMAVPETRALCLPDRFSHGPGEAFIDDHEFCHLHAAPPGGVHLTLPEPLRRAAVASGWAEQHPAVSGGILPATVVMVYAPRDAQELGVVLRLVEASRLFAEGVLPNVRESA